MATILANPFKQATKYAVAYMRVSTDMQTVENQRIVIQEFAGKNEYMVLDWYADEGISGSVPAIQREAFVKLIEFVKDNPVDAILVYEISRIGRTFYDTIDVVRTLEQKMNVPIIACSPKEWFLQTADKMTRQITLSMYSIFAERERDMIKERTKDGMARVRATGRHIGRPPKIINHNLLTKLVLQQVPRCQMAKMLGVSKGTLYKELNNLKLVRVTYRK